MILVLFNDSRPDVSNSMKSIDEMYGCVAVVVVVVDSKVVD